MPIPLAIPIVGGLVVATGTVLALRAKAKKKVDPLRQNGVPVVAIPFNPSAAPAPQAIVPGRDVTGIPVITAEQFSKQSVANQQNIREQALKGILTLSATDGTLFAEKPPQPAEDFIGAFKPGADLKGLFLTVDPALSRRFGLPLPVPDGGNVIFEALAQAGQTTVSGLSRDPRLPGFRAEIPLNAITGGGDPG
jgi:hypothetical protein